MKQIFFPTHWWRAIDASVKALSETMFSLPGELVRQDTETYLKTFDRLDDRDLYSLVQFGVSIGRHLEKQAAEKKAQETLQPEDVLNFRWAGSFAKPIKQFYARAVRRDGPNDIEQCEAKDAEFWSVYAIDSDGMSFCLADLPSKSVAHDVAKMFELILHSK